MSDYNNPLFADRHIGPDSDAVATMLEVIGVDSLDELARRALPAGNPRRIDEFRIGTRSGPAAAGGQ